MHSPAIALVTCYFAATVLTFLGTLIVDGVSTALGLAQPALFQLWLYFFTALFAYLTMFYLTTELRSSWIDQSLLGLSLVLVVLIFFWGARLLIPVSVLTLGLSGWLCYRSRDLLFRVSLAGFAVLGLGMLGAEIMGGAAWFGMGQVWLGGASTLLWTSMYLWYLLDGGRIALRQARKTLCLIAGLLLVGSIIGCFWPRALPMVKTAQVSPLFILWANSYKQGRDRFWEVVVLYLFLSGLSAAPTAAFYWRALVWPIFIIGLILFPRRHRRRLLGLVPMAGSEAREELLKLGTALFLGGSWIAVTGLTLVGNTVLIVGFLQFFYGLFAAAKAKPSPTDYLGEGHITQGY